MHLGRVLRPDEMSVDEVLSAMAASSIVITTHGAAAANMMFLPKVAPVYTKP